MPRPALVISPKLHAFGVRTVSDCDLRVGACKSRCGPMATAFAKEVRSDPVDIRSTSTDERSARLQNEAKR